MGTFDAWLRSAPFASTADVGSADYWRRGSPLRVIEPDATVLKTATDTATFILTETASPLVLLSRADTATLVGALDAINNLRVSFTTTDTATFVLVETAIPLVPLLATDTATLAGAVDTVTNLKVFVDRTDTASIAAAVDAVANLLVKPGLRTDTATFTLTETAQVAVAIATADTALFRADEAAVALLVFLSRADTATLTLSEIVGTIRVYLSLTDTAILTLIELASREQFGGIGGPRALYGGGSRRR